MKRGIDCTERKPLHDSPENLGWKELIGSPPTITWKTPPDSVKVEE